MLQEFCAYILHHGTELPKGQASEALAGKAHKSIGAIPIPDSRPHSRIPATLKDSSYYDDQKGLRIYNPVACELDH
jgi:hypothetical protein